MLAGSAAALFAEAKTRDGMRRLSRQHAFEEQVFSYFCHMGPGILCATLLNRILNTIPNMHKQQPPQENKMKVRTKVKAGNAESKQKLTGPCVNMALGDGLSVCAGPTADPMR